MSERGPGAVDPPRGEPPAAGYLLGEERVRALRGRAAAWRPLLCGAEEDAPARAWDPALLGVTRAEIFLTGACNLRCRYCKSRLRAPAPWPEGALQALIAELAGRGTRHVQWTGGEASLDPALLPAARSASALGLTGSLSTNGTAEPGVYEALFEAGIGRFYISLDLLEPGAFDLQVGASGLLGRVMDNVRRLCAGPPGGRPHVTVNSVLDPAALRALLAGGGAELRRLLAWCLETGVDDFKFLPASGSRLVTCFPDQEHWDAFEALCRGEATARFPMLRHRLGTLRAGGHGLRGDGPHHCWFSLDDRAFDSEGAWPCIVRMREGAPPLWRHGAEPGTCARRLAAFLAEDRRQDPICAEHCFDLYRDLSRAAARP